MLVTLGTYNNQFILTWSKQCQRSQNKSININVFDCENFINSNILRYK